MSNDEALIAVCRQFVADYRAYRVNEIDSEAVFEGLCGVFDQIGATPATTVSGITWKAKAVAEWLHHEMQDAGCGEDIVLHSLIRDAANLEDIA